MRGSEVPYHLRQNKYVDRQLFMEILSHVDRFMPIREAFYISFAGVYFEDQKLLHSMFGSERLYSIESEDWVYQRQLANRPYACIRCLHQKSSELIDSLEDLRGKQGKRAGIFWFDYAEANKRRQQLEEFNRLLKVGRVHDVIRVTMNANSDSLAKREQDELPAAHNRRRLDKLKEVLGDRLPAEVTSDELSKSAFPKLLQKLVVLEAADALKSKADVVFQLLGTYSYADSEHTMLTVTGIILKQDEVKDFIKKSGLKSFAFAGLGGEVFPINVPMLSPREKFLLDSSYKKGIKSEKVSKKLKFQFAPTTADSQSKVKAYFDFHRFYPHFHRIQY